MKWMRERDALIAQTLAFVQSVTGRRDAGGPVLPVLPEPPPLPATSPSPAVSAFVEGSKGPEKGSLEMSSREKPGLEKSAEPGALSPSPRPMVPSDFQRELKARIETFRAHQERFNRERDEYFSATLARLRASIKDGPPTPRA